MQTGRGFVFLPSYYEALRGLPDEMRLALYDAILDFGFRGQEPALPDPIALAFFALLRPTIQSSVEKYEAQCRNGSKGGRARTAKTQPEPNDNPTETQVEANLNPTETQVEANLDPTETQAEPKGKPEKDKEYEKEYDKDKDREWDKETLRAYRADEPPRAARFTAPTMEEVSSYCQERRNRVDAERFVDFYTSKRNGCQTARAGDIINHS